MRKSLAVILLISLMGIGQHEVAKAGMEGGCRYICSYCAYVYEPAISGTPFMDLPIGWCCPTCGHGVEDFTLLDPQWYSPPCPLTGIGPNGPCRMVIPATWKVQNYDASGHPVNYPVCVDGSCPGSIVQTLDYSTMACSGGANCSEFNSCRVTYSNTPGYNPIILRKEKLCYIGASGGCLNQEYVVRGYPPACRECRCGNPCP